MRIMVRVGDLMQMTRDNRTDRVLGGRTIGRSSDAMYNMHRARGDEKHGFLG
jgi:hypothetical protein